MIQNHRPETLPQIFQTLDECPHLKGVVGIRNECIDMDCITYGTLLHCYMHHSRGTARRENPSTHLLDVLLHGIEAHETLESQQEALGRTPLLLAVEQSGRVEDVQRLLDHGANVSAVDSFNRDIACLAAISRSPQMIDFVLNYLEEHVAASTLRDMLTRARCQTGINAFSWIRPDPIRAAPLVLVAVETDNHALIRRLVNRYNVSVRNAFTIDGHSVLSRVRTASTLETLFDVGWEYDPNTTYAYDELVGALNHGLLGDSRLVRKLLDHVINHGDRNNTMLLKYIRDACTTALRHTTHPDNWADFNQSFQDVVPRLIKLGGNITASSSGGIRGTTKFTISTPMYAIVAFSQNPEFVLRCVEEFERVLLDVGFNSTETLNTKVLRRVATLTHWVDAAQRRLLSAVSRACNTLECFAIQVEIFERLRTVSNTRTIKLSELPIDAVEELLCQAAGALNHLLLDRVLTAARDEAGFSVEKITRIRCCSRLGCLEGKHDTLLQTAVKAHHKSGHQFEPNSYINTRSVSTTLATLWETLSSWTEYINACDLDGFSAVHYAVLSYDAAALMFLNNTGADMNQRVCNTQTMDATPLFLALYKGPKDVSNTMVPLLLTLGAQIAYPNGSMVRAMSDCRTALHMAVTRHPWALRTLIAAVTATHNVTVAELLEFRATCDENGYEQGGYTVLHTALSKPTWDSLGCAIFPGLIHSLIRRGANATSVVVDAHRRKILTSFHILAHARSWRWHFAMVARILINATAPSLPGFVEKYQVRLKKVMSAEQREILDVEDDVVMLSREASWELCHRAMLSLTESYECNKVDLSVPLNS